MVFVPHWPKNLKRKIPVELKLNRVLEVLGRLNDPHLKIPPTIHIAGTNGKGSTTSYIANILEASGFKVHKFTSPHLINFNERIVLNGKQISDEYLFDIFERTRVASDLTPVISGPNIGLSLFEATTIAAFIAFSEIKADFLVCEVGMGGRLDPTNVIQNVILSIITPISLDHQEFLGDTEELIAHEKAGIIKKRIPVISGPQSENVMRILEYHAQINCAPIYRYGYEYSSEFLKNENFFKYKNLENKTIKSESTYDLPKLRGPHQTENASIAIAASEILSSRYCLEIFYEDINDAIKNTYWPARIEKIETGKIKQMIPESWELFLDGAHNAGGAATLARWICEYAKSKPVYMIFGTTRGKDLTPYLLELKDFVKFTCCVCVSHETNAYLGSEILKMTEKISMLAKAFDYVPEALNFIMQNFYENQNEKNDAIILICGSLYLAGDILKINQGLLV